MPHISVIMPTYKRPEMLRRAVESVIAQSYQNWELIISDDEKPGGETWAYLQELAQMDSRIRVYQHEGENGQIPNNNFAMSKATGLWIKPLFDDDVLPTHCLARFHQAATDGQDTAAVICCLADVYVDGELSKPAKRGSAALLERITGPDALRAAYLQDVDIGTPVQCMVRADLVQSGVWWEELEGMNSAFDTWWLVRLLEHGDLLMLNESQAQLHLGHMTGTAEMQAQPDKLDEDYMILREHLHRLIADQPDVPPLSVAKQQLKLIRATVRLRDGRWLDAFTLAISCWRCQAWRLFWRWLKNRRHPGMDPVAPREVVWP